MAESSHDEQSSESDMEELRNDSSASEDDEASEGQSLHRLSDEDHSDNNEPDHGQPYDDLSYYDQSDASDDHWPNPLLDLEAEFDDKSNDDIDDESDEDRHLAPANASRPIGYWDGQDFPQFQKLPAELRIQIWELACPFICQRARVIQVGLHLPYPKATSLTVRPEVMLSKQMEPVCALLRVNRESNDVVKRALPDTLEICQQEPRRGSLLHFNRAKDVVHLDVTHVVAQPSSPMAPPAMFSIPGFSEKIENISMGDTWETLHDLVLDDQYHILAWLLTFPNLKTVFQFRDSADEAERQFYHWCGFERFLNICNLVHEELDEYGRIEVLPTTFVWPDLIENRDFALHELSEEVENLGDVIKELSTELEFGNSAEEVSKAAARFADVDIWPMVLFAGDEGQMELHIVSTTPLEHLPEKDPRRPESEDDGDVNDSEEEDSEMDDFIDDDPHAEPNSNSEDEDEDEDDLGSGSDEAPFNGFSPIEIGSDNSQIDQDDAPTLVPEDEDDDEEEDVRPLKRKMAGRVVDDSDSDAEADKDVRPSKRHRARVVSDSDDEDEEEQNSSRSLGQSHNRRAVVIDSDSDDNEEDADVKDRPAKHSIGFYSALTKPTSEDEDESDDDDGTDNGMSFAEMLEAHREAHPVSSSSDGSSDGSGVSLDHDISDEEEDGGEDSGVSGDSGDSDGGGVIDDMASDDDLDDGSGYDDDDGW